MDLFDLFCKISIDLTDFERGIETAKTKAEGFAKNLSGVSSSISKAYSNVGDALQPAVDGFKAVEGVGKKAGNAIMTGMKGFTVAATAVGGFGTAAVKSGMQFDATMSEVSAISGKVADEDLPDIIKAARDMGLSFENTGDATSTAMSILRNKALEMGATTKFSASEAGEAMTYMAMAGWKAGDMISGIEGIMNLAAASGEDLATTSDIVTDALTAFGLQASDSGHFADILAVASSNANTNVGMMGDTFKYVAPIAGAMGYSAEDTAVAIGLMANSGIKATQAGTSLRSIMTRLAKPTKESQAAMDVLGLSITNSDGSMKSLNEIIGDMRVGFSGLTESEKASFAAMLGGQEAMSGLLAIVNASEADVQKLTAAIDDCNGAAKEMAATMVDNLQGDLTLLGSAFESLQIAISDSLTPTLREFAQFGQKAMANLLEGFQGRGVSGFMSALSSIVTDGTKMLAQKAPEFASVSLQFVQALADGLLNAGNEILVAGDKIAYMLIDGVGTWLAANSDKLLDLGYGLVSNIFNAFVDAGDIISENIGKFVPLIADAFTAYHEALFTVGLDILGAIGQGIIDHKEEIQHWASMTIRNMVTSLRDNAPMIIDGGIALLQVLVGAIQENLPLILEAGAEIIGQLVAGIATAGPEVQAIIGVAVLPHILKIIDTVSSIGGAVTDVVKLVVGENGIKKVLDIGKKLMGGIQALFGLIMAHPVVAVITAVIAAVTLLWTHCEEFRNFVKGAVDAIVGFVSGAIDAIVGFFGNIIDFVANNWQTLLLMIVNPFAGAFKLIYDNCEEFRNFIDGLMEAVKDLFEAGWEAVKGFFLDGWAAITSVWETAVGFFSDIGAGIQDVFSAVTGAVGEFFSDAWNAVKGVWNAATGFFSKIWDGIKTAAGAAADAVKGPFTKAWDAITSVWNGAMDFFGGIWDSIKNVFSNALDVFGNIGSNIVNGLKNGIKNAWSGLTGWFGGLFDNLVSGVRGKLEIHSPSGVFADIGGNMALGLGVGWDDEYNAIKRKIEGGMNFGTASVGLVANTTGYSAPRSAQNAPQTGVSGAGNTYVTINSPVAVDAVTAAREWQKTTQRMAMAY